jgi:hypothetical protein
MIPRFSIRTYALITVGVVLLITVLAVLIALEARKDAGRAKVGQTLADGRTAAAGDASAIRDKADARTAETEAITEETADAIRSAPDDAAAGDAALRGLCRLYPGRDPRCRVQQPDPRRVD